MAESYGDRIREDIDYLDGQIRDLLAERFDLVACLHIWKSENGLPIYDPNREAKIVSAYVQDFGEEDGTALARVILGKYSEVEE